ncbi:MAG: glycosyltransferase, partial [Dysgonamonadaceae bacterium]|nr:glycosyltransferase [Dysgonamonadaceae bacterium]
LNQTYKNIEYILIDGGSTDNTMEIVDRYRDKIDIVISEKDKGQSDAINKGFRLASGVLAGWINSDDILYPDCVEKIVELYKRQPDGSIFYPSRLDFIDKNDAFIKTIGTKITGKNYLLNTCYDVIQQGSFYSADLLKKIGYLNENVHYCMDLDLWLRLLDYAPIYYLEGSPISAFRIWDGTKTTSGNMAFINEIGKTLQKYGAKPFSRTKKSLLVMRMRIYGGMLKRKLMMK